MQIMQASCSTAQVSCLKILPLYNRYVSDKKLLFFKAAINIFILTTESNHYVYVSDVARGDKPRENDQLTLQFPSALQSFVAFFSSLFWSETLQFFRSVSPL